MPFDPFQVRCPQRMETAGLRPHRDHSEIGEKVATISESPAWSTGRAVERSAQFSNKVPRQGAQGLIVTAKETAGDDARLRAQRIHRELALVIAGAAASVSQIKSARVNASRPAWMKRRWSNRRAVDRRLFANAATDQHAFFADLADGSGRHGSTAVAGDAQSCRPDQSKAAW